MQSNNRPDNDRNFSDDNYWTGNPYGNASPNEWNDYSEEEYNRPVKRTFVGVGPKGYTRSDESIEEDVCRLLFHSRDIDATDMDVEVSDGCVHLTGSVPYNGMRGAAEDLAREVSGVKKVINELHVNSLFRA